MYYNLPILCVFLFVYIFSGLFLTGPCVRYVCCRLYISGLRRTNEAYGWPRASVLERAPSLSIDGLNK
jgi:hypothetical protein